MNLRNKIRGSAIQVVKRLVDNGHEAYIVGGAVRDLLLGCTPKDVDITTSATPEQVREVFGRRQCIIIGRRFRLAHVRMGDEIYEVSTFRREPTAEERRGRLDDDGEMIWNDNQFGTLEDDAMRRDFTVNALYFDPIGERGIIDLVGGREDLKNKVVRVIGDAKTRFIEDPVRMLRALKLVGMYGFSMTQDTEEALREKRGMIQLASISRLYEELLKIFMTGYSLSIFTTFQKYGFLGCFWSSFDAQWDTNIGRMSRRLLGARDKKIRQGSFSNSKALALATTCLPFVMKDLQPESEDEDEDWTHKEGVSAACLEMIRRFYDNFVLPHIYSLRVKDILLLVPVLCNENIAHRFYRHREYKYSRLLIGLLVDGLGWDPELFDRLPEPDDLVGLQNHKRRRQPRKKIQTTMTGENSQV